MAPKFLKTVTVILALATFVGTTTLCVHVPTAIASTGSGGCTNGDPDSPKDTAPKQASATSQVMTGHPTIVSQPQTRVEWVRWIVVNQILNSLFGSPGLMR
jgi:hypothetical protein